MTTIYRWLYCLVLQLLPFLHGASAKLSKGYKMRAKVNGRFPWELFPAHSNPIWFHCASGEFEYALPLIRRFKQQNPEQKILVTYFTHSYGEKIKKEPLVDFACPSPWDTPEIAKNFIDHFQPRAFLISRSDVWPEVSHICRSQNIPTILFSMTFNKKFQNIFSWPLQKYYRWQYSGVDWFFVVSEDDQKHLAQVVNPAKIKVLGDTRYDQCLFRLQQPCALRIDAARFHKKVLVLGSTWPEDEAALALHWPALVQNFHLILVPHEIEPKHLEKLKNQLEAARLNISFYSKISSWPETADSVLIVDQVGVLAHLYKLADVSFVGGSFQKRVHSVMESLACLAPVVVGPYYTNNREAMEFSNLTPPIVVPTTADTLGPALIELAHSWTTARKESLQKTIQDKTKATDRVFQALQPLIERSL